MYRTFFAALIMASSMISISKADKAACLKECNEKLPSIIQEVVTGAFQGADVDDSAERINDQTENAYYYCNKWCS